MMLVGEGSVFVLILLGGAYMIKRAYKKEHQLNKLQENFLLSISHELKTPIASVTLFLQTLQKRELDAEKRDDIYAQSLNEIKRLESLVSNLLITRSIDNNNYFLNKSAQPLDEIINSTVRVLSTSVLKNYQIKQNLEPHQILADHEAMVSVVSNLLSNAAKYSPQGSEISINLKKTGSEIILEISDQGIGIHDEKKKMVFDRFYREENEMTRKSKGTGLGLFITKFLVHQHQGRIELHDNKPCGLTVKLFFPII